MKPLALLLLLSALPSCAVTRYPRLMPLTTNERAAMTCEQLDNEIADVLKFKEQTKLGTESWDQIYALKYADDRIDSCIGAKIEKGCPQTAISSVRR